MSRGLVGASAAVGALGGLLLGTWLGGELKGKKALGIGGLIGMLVGAGGAAALASPSSTAALPPGATG